VIPGGGEVISAQFAVSLDELDTADPRDPNESG